VDADGQGYAAPADVQLTVTSLASLAARFACTMTPVSRSVASGRGLRRVRSASDAARLAWHVGCIFLVPGCLYVAPVKRPAVNHPPVIVYPDGPNPGSVVLRGLSTQLNAIATDDDPEDTTLFFVWEGVPAELDPPAPITTPLLDPPGFISTWSIPFDPSLAGATIEVHVTDGHDTTGYAWLVTVED
jgi:hypothetical protein